MGLSFLMPIKAVMSGDSYRITDFLANYRDYVASRNKITLLIVKLNQIFCYLKL